MNITLKPIDESNFLDAFHLQLRETRRSTSPTRFAALRRRMSTAISASRSAFTLTRGWWDTSW